jgi:hypothetical protein
VERISPSGKDEEREVIKLEFEPAKETASLLVNLAFFMSAIKAYQTAANARSKRNEIQKILSAADWYVHYTDKKTGRRVLSESIRIEYDHERRTAINLAQMNYDVVFAPNVMFNRSQKKFDVYLLRDTIILEADMKSVTSINPDTIANRIFSGSEQASRVVLDIKSAISAKDLVDALRSGTGKNRLIKEILLFYKNRFYRLPVDFIWSKKIFDILKSEKGYT